MSPVRRLFSEGFRVFFLAAGLFAALSMILWEGWLAFQAAGGVADLPLPMAPHLWHAHEMIFGFTSAAVAGFLLTAVPNWTGAKGAPHLFIAAAAGLWLAGRIAVLASGHLPPGVVALADLAFVPVLWVKVLVPLLARPKPQQLLLLLILGLYWLANLLVHLEWLGLAQTEWAGLRMGLLTISAMIMVLGGRVTPGFTRNAMVQSGRESGLPWNPMPLAALSIAAALTQPVGYLLALPQGVMGALALLAGIAGLVRVALWRGLWTRNRPILWSLHLSYALNAAGFVLLGLAGLGVGSEVAALHLLGIGAVGGMTLAVMSRATLGHTGRALVAPGPVALAYALVPVAALMRIAGAVWATLHDPAVLIAGALWIIAFALYVVALWPVFWGQRVPRAPVNAPPASTPSPAKAPPA